MKKIELKIIYIILIILIIITTIFWYFILNKIDLWFNQKIILNNIKKDIEQELRITSFKDCNYLKKNGYNDYLCNIIKEQDKILEYDILDIIKIDEKYKIKINFIFKEKNNSKVINWQSTKNIIKKNWLWMLEY